ncbi:MAG: hypothetical protein NTU95_11070 [Methanothrix sp.]|nr:hypothetical protein [Methanothrix sp.]
MRVGFIHKACLALFILFVLGKVTSGEDFSELFEEDNDLFKRHIMPGDPFDLLEYDITHYHMKYPSQQIPLNYYGKNITFLSLSFEERYKLFHTNSLINSSTTAPHNSSIESAKARLNKIKENFEDQEQARKELESKLDSHFYYNISNTYNGLENLIWNFLPSWTYREDFFDCSEMAAYVDHKLELYGFDAKICVSHNFGGTGNGHAWIAVDLPPGILSDEMEQVYATGPKSRNLRRYFIEPTMIPSTYIWQSGPSCHREEFLSGELSCDQLFIPDKQLIIIPEDGLYFICTNNFEICGELYSKNVEYYKNYEAIYEDIYQACANESVETFNWWATLETSELESTEFLNETRSDYLLRKGQELFGPGGSWRPDPANFRSPIIISPS